MVAIVLPVTALVATGVEHSIANMYPMSLTVLIQHFDPVSTATIPLTWLGMAENLLPVVAGNLVGLAYDVIYPRGASGQLTSNATEKLVNLAEK